ncbi:hypothetical protein, partial [Pseudomonas viridiflava]|uniref:hypothetical protein n=1 Tax=Pseudomonas viridiflava TaxID=33069 RepID=UPI00198042BF
DGVSSVTDKSLQKKHRRQAASHSPWSQQDSGITLSTSMGMIGVLEIMLIVPTLCAHRYTQVATRIWSGHYFGRGSGPGGVPFVRESWYIRRRSSV